MKHTGHEEYLQQRQKQADEWMENVGKHNGLLPVSNQNLLKHCRGGSRELATDLILNLDTDFTKNGSLHSVRNWLTQEILSNLVSSTSVTAREIFPYVEVFVDSLDCFSERKEIHGLIENSGTKRFLEYQQYAKFGMDAGTFEEVRVLVKTKSRFFGLGCYSTQEYLEFISSNKSPEDAFCLETVRLAQRACIAIKEKNLKVDLRLLPQGPLDTRIYGGLWHGFGRA